MNCVRRHTIQEILDKVIELQEALCTVSESERYEKTDTACDSLSDALEHFEEIISSLETAIF